ncbi:hypothetical protein [Bacteroides fragilis]|uniref:hypothetical protein n=2 Tax=Bacteroides TaxID=816 RepID=UPI002030DDC1|nr:hypothetical protein [Bacteroides fragilis]
MYKILVYIFILFCFFPFVQILPMGTDSQPNALCISLLLFLLKPIWKVDKYSKNLLFVFVASCVIWVFSSIQFSALRSLFNYFSLFYLTFISYNVLRYINGIPYPMFCCVVILWFLVGAIQLFIYPDFLSFLIPRGSSSLTVLSGRGVICLTPEPTFYGIMCLLFMMIGYLNFREKRGVIFVQLILAWQLFFFSRSSMCLFVIIISFIIYYIFRLLLSRDLKSFVLILFLLSSLYIVFPLLLQFVEEYRIGELLTKLWENPWVFITLDASVNERFNHVFFPLYGFFANWGLPHGFDQFGVFMEDCFRKVQFQELFSDYIYNASYNRIMSAIAGALFELGWIASFILIFIFNVFKPLIIENKTNMLILILLIGILLNAITFSNAIIPFFLGNVLFLNRKLVNHF